MQTDPQRPNRDFMARILAAMCLLAILIGVVLLWMPMAAQAEDTALLIGVGKYQDRSFNGLPFAVNDVRQFETVLADRGYVVRSLYYDDDQQPDLDQVPLRRHILAEVESILRRAGSGDRVVLAYSGHGVNIDGAAYLCPTDSDLRDRETLIPVERIRQWIKESRATHVSFFCDACQEEIGQKAIMRNLGSDVRSGMIPSENFRVALANSNLGLKQQKRTIVQSCRPAQVAYADEELRHGVFFHFLIQAFKGSGDTDRNGELEHQELVSYLAKNVQDYVADRFGQRQFVYPEISGDSDLPLMQLAEGPTWLPNDCQPHERARLVSIRGFGGTQRCYSHVVLTPRWTDVADPAKSNPLLGVDGQPISIELVLVPQLTFEMPPTFYISRDKVSVRLWRAYESAAPGKMDASAAKERQRFSADPDSPMFWVTGMEALAFCRDMWKGTEDGIEFRGTLPTPAQWDAAYGQRFDALAASRAGYDQWLGRNAKSAGWASGVPSGLPAGRFGNPDVSPYGVRDMGCNGLELTRMDSDWDRLIPHNREPSQMDLRGRSYHLSEPLTSEFWRSAGLPDRFFFTTHPVKEARDDVGFRLVLAR